LARLLIKQGRNTRVLLSKSAERFVGEQTFAGITGAPVHREMFGPGGGELHVRLAAEADVIVVAPATADALARLAHGRADDLFSATTLCFDGPLYVAPAMHPRMWSHPATQSNVTLLRARGVTFLGPAHGQVASGDEGFGRMLEPAQIVEHLLSPPQSDLAGKRLIVTAGPTVEDLDPVRFISNRSSGKMGFALAERAARRGANVELVSGPVNLPTPPGVTRHDIRSALELLDVLRGLLQQPTDALLMAAAVGDFRAKEIESHKLQRAGDTSLALVENPDIIATLARERTTTGPILMAFAVETGEDGEIIARARTKLARKGVDVVVANRADEALGKDDNRVQIVEADGHRSLPRMPKTQLADSLLDWLRESSNRDGEA
jgi:phosphopantothenoylcysteine decarboxylase/phosphopantothenate--cysteine ligase